MLNADWLYDTKRWNTIAPSVSICRGRRFSLLVFAETAQIQRQAVMHLSTEILKSPVMGLKAKSVLTDVT